jgi:hypothetical protein
MEYLLLIYGNEATLQASSKEVASQRTAAYMAYAESMKKAGVYIGANRLQPTRTATSVRTNGGKTSVVDGPFAETKEQLGGYILIDAKDLDTALSWAARCPGTALGTVEVRPIWPI